MANRGILIKQEAEDQLSSICCWPPYDNFFTSISYLITSFNTLLIFSGTAYNEFYFVKLCLFDVPEAELPEPFNQRDITVSVPSLPEESSIETLSNIAEAELLNPSHLPPSFKKRFSTKVVDDSAKTELLPSPVEPSSIKTDTTSDNKSAFSSNLDPVKHEKPLQVEISVETPDLSTPKRSMPTEDKKLKSMLRQKIMIINSITKRSMNLEGKNTSAGDSSTKVEDTSENDVIAQSGLKAFQPTSDCFTDILKASLFTKSW
ncbi:CDT1 Geminin-binding domain-like protein [Artemisia annua]|uniref:CDT1 Geminin-binding domain-like protein n=1 Tax=Artemisia annua TaxID=35608 RepID=A0A2U1KGC0_ARTAN|nr:CDT1 Geminin-binding domain-like protein [Artemisia annua]